VTFASSNTFHGSESPETRVINQLAENFKKQNGIDLRQDPLALQRLTEAVQKALLDLSTQDATEINLPFIAANPAKNKPLHLKTRLTRDELNALRL
jgi:molecular chaperone DnaK